MQVHGAVPWSVRSVLVNEEVYEPCLRDPLKMIDVTQHYDGSLELVLVKLGRGCPHVAGRIEIITLRRHPHHTPQSITT
jgi:hypothetical protein